MKHLLDALQEGRLIELPVSDKDKSLEFMALMLEAIPDIGADMDIVKEILEREKSANTGIGLGIACPHVRTRREGEIFCAVGWSPNGIEYGAIDGKKVHLLVTYYIPDNQRNIYLKELSGLAKAIKETTGIESIEELGDIQSVRNRLLDWMEISMAKVQPVAKARMIKLEAIQAARTVQPIIPTAITTRFDIVPFYILLQGNGHCTVLSQNLEFAEAVEKSEDTARLFAANRNFEWNSHQISIMSSRQFSMNRMLLECVAVKVG
jgi:nitrogen PTS system EIIA component